MVMIWGIYYKKLEESNFKSDKNIYDVIIAGGGIAGIATAMRLQKKGN